MTLAKRSLLAALTAGLLSLPASAADVKLAVINLKTVFDGYWKTKQSDVTVKERQADFEKERKKMVDDYQKANEEYRKLIDSAADQAVSADERDKRKKTAEGKLLDIKEIEQNIGQFDRNFRSQMGDQIKRMRDNILREIREVVSTKARAGTYTLVIDTAAETVNATPIVLFSVGSPDLTEEVLTKLNENAPPGALTSDKTDTKAGETKPADAKPGETKEDKK